MTEIFLCCMLSVEMLAFNMSCLGGNPVAIPACTALNIYLSFGLYIYGMCQTEKRGAAGAASFGRFVKAKLSFL